MGFDRSAISRLLSILPLISVEAVILTGTMSECIHLFQGLLYPDNRTTTASSPSEHESDSDISDAEITFSGGGALEIGVDARAVIASIPLTSDPTSNNTRLSPGISNSRPGMTLDTNDYTSAPSTYCFSTALSARLLAGYRIVLPAIEKRFHGPAVTINILAMLSIPLSQLESLATDFTALGNWLWKVTHYTPDTHSGAQIFGTIQRNFRNHADTILRELLRSRSDLACIVSEERRIEYCSEILRRERKIKRRKPGSSENEYFSHKQTPTSDSGIVQEGATPKLNPDSWQQVEKRVTEISDIFGSPFLPNVLRKLPPDTLVRLHDNSDLNQWMASEMITYAASSIYLQVLRNTSDIF
jgi:hypothetical protein